MFGSGSPCKGQQGGYQLSKPNLVPFGFPRLCSLFLVASLALGEVGEVFVVGSQPECEESRSCYGSKQDTGAGATLLWSFPKRTNLLTY